MRRLITATVAAAVAALLVVIVVANAQPGVGFKRSADFSGTGSSGSAFELSTNVTMPGIASVAGATGAPASTASLTVVATDDGVYSTSILLKATPAMPSDSSVIRWAKSDGTLRWSMGNNTDNGAPLHDFWIYDSTNLNYMLYADPAAVSSLRFGLSDGRLRYTDSTHTWTMLTNGVTRLTLADALITGAVASQWNDDATFESGTCVINSAGITCGGTLMTPGADVTGVVVTDPACAAGSYVSTLTGGATSGSVPIGGTCVAEVGDISNVTASAPISGGGASGSVSVGLTTCAAGEAYLMSGGVWTCTAVTAGADITGVTAGAGLTGGGTSGAVTLDVACLTGLTCNANDIAITARDFGDITTSSSGSVWTIDNTTVTSAKLNITTTACSGTDKISSISAGAVGTCTADIDTGITNSAGNNVVMKSNGTNAVASSTTDDGTSVTIGASKFVVTVASGNTAVGGTLDVASTLTVAASQLFDSKGQATMKFISGDDTTPSIGTCGTSPSIDANSNNLAGKFTTGSGGGGTACELTFNGTWSPAAPWCVVFKQSDGAIVAPDNMSLSTTVISISSSLVASTGYRYMCLGGN